MTSALRQTENNRRLSRVLGTFLFGIAPGDPITLASPFSSTPARWRDGTSSKHASGPFRSRRCSSPLFSPPRPRPSPESYLPWERPHRWRDRGSAAAVGAVIGVVAAWILRIYLPASLPGGHRLPGVIPAAVLALTVAGALATLGPARRALRIEPVEALRSDG